MTMLHTVNKSPFERNNLDSCLRHAVKGSAVLLLEDGVYGALQGTAFSGRVADATADLRIYVLGPDLAARGLDQGAVVPGITVIDYNGFVDLTVEHSAVQAWL